MLNFSILSPKQLSPALATVGIALSTICFGMTPFFAKSISETGLASSAVAFYRVLFSVILFLPILAFGRNKRTATFWAISSGVAMGVGWVAYVEALKSAPVATVGVMYMTYPLFTLLISILWLRQYPSPRSIFAGILVIAAALLALTPTSAGVDSLQPLLLSLLTPLGFAYGIVVLTNKLTLLTPLERTAGTAFGSILGLLPLVLSLDSSVVIPSRLDDWLLILGLALITKLFPSVMYNIAGPFIGSARTAIVGCIELPVMFIVGWLAFGEQVTLLQWVSGILVIYAIWLTSTSKVSESPVLQQRKI